MPVYMIAVICTAALSGIVMLLIFRRLKAINFRTVASITLAALVTALVLPVIFSALFGERNESMDLSFLLTIVIAGFVAYLVIVLIFSVLISCIVPKIKSGSAVAKQEPAKAEKTVNATAMENSSDSIIPTDQISCKVQTEPSEAETVSEDSLQQTPEYAPKPEEKNMAENEAVPPQEITSTEVQGGEREAEGELLYEAEAMTSQEDVLSEASADSDEGEETPEASAGDNYLEQIYINFIKPNDEKIIIPSDNEENEAKVEISEEKFVDSNENIDKMGIESIIQNSGTMTIEECIDEAFKLRETDELEDSILYCMYALDKKPRKELTFWIVLDICVMYKSLGQLNLALDILNSYYEIYSDMMENSVREEIIRNLIDVSV